MVGVKFIFLALVVCCYFQLNSVVWAQTSPSENKSASLIEQIQSARAAGDMTLADELAAKLVAFANEHEDMLLKADGYYEQARNAMERNRYEEAQASLNLAINYYQDSNQRQGLADAYRQLGLTYRYQAEYRNALEYIYLAMQINQELGDQSAIASTYNSIGVVLEKMGQYEESTAAHQSALEIHHALGDQQGIAGSLFNLGDIRRVLGDFELSIEYFKNALQLDIAAGDKKNIAYSKHKMGYVLLQMGQLEQARPFINEALALFQQIETPRDTDWVYTSIAELEMESGNLRHAKEIIDGVINRAIENSYHSLLVDAYKTAAEIAYRQEDDEGALKYVEAGLKRAQLNLERMDEALLEEIRAKILLRKESLKEAIVALQRQKALDDELLNEKRLKAIASVQAQSEFVRREHQIELLEKEKALQQATIERNRLMRNQWIGGLVCAIALIFLLYGRIVQFRLNRRLEAKVTERTQQLAEKNIELQHAYEEMEAISLTDKLTGLQNRRFLEKQINADLDKSIRQYKDWLNGKSLRPKDADIVMFMIDMDNFKQINDDFGHEAGDKVLIQLAERMGHVFRQSDHLVRWGGEEFVAIARFIDRNDAQRLAQRMTDVVNQTPFLLDDQHSQTLSCSIGFSCFPMVPEEPVNMPWQSLISMADACLYSVKGNGKNGWLGVEKVLDSSLEIEDISLRKMQDWYRNNKIKLKGSIRIRS